MEMPTAKKATPAERDASVCGHHRLCPEIWFAPTKRTPFLRLYTRVAKGEITATLRLGKRTDEHPKGYKPGERATLRVLDSARTEQLTRIVRITRVTPKTLGSLSVEDLSMCKLYSNIGDVVGDFMGFEGRPIDRDEEVTVVVFSYLV